MSAWAVVLLIVAVDLAVMLPWAYWFVPSDDGGTR